MTVSTWNEVSERLKALKISGASFARRCDISESTFSKGVKRNAKLQPSTASVVRRVLKEIEQETLQ